MATDRSLTENGALIDAVEGLSKPQTLVLHPPGGLRELDHEAMVVAVPRGMQLLSVKPFLDEYRALPERRTGTARLTNLASFVAHVNRFKGPSTAVFAHDDARAPKLTCILDYHEEGPDGDPAFGQHRSEYTFPITGEWATWTREHSFTQASFAEFLEDRLADVIEPAAVGESIKAFAARLGITLAGQAGLMALSKGLAVHVDQKVATAVSLSTGEGQVVFEEAHRDGQGAPLRVPSGFAVAIPVFSGGALYQLPVRLRYRVKQGAVSWHLAVHRAELVFRHAFDEACEAVRKETGLPVFYGQPEQ